MKKQLRDRIERALHEEETVEINETLLTALRELSGEESNYFGLSPSDRNALNHWFNEVKEVLFKEILIGDYGIQILLDSLFILCFEVGYKLAKKGGGDLY